MSEGDRIHGRVTALNYESTLRFFEKRAERFRDLGPLSVTMYQDHNPQLAVERDRWESQTILPLLRLGERVRVLDVGCGVGRWTRHLEPHVGQYLGIDFSAGLLDVAKELAAELPDPERFRFQRLSAADIGKVTLDSTPPFDVVLVAGVMIYLNDEDCAAMLSAITSLAAPGCVVYVREPVALTTRLTLERFYSTELCDNYSAIYRTMEQYQSLFAEGLVSSGFTLRHAQDLYPADLHNRKETAQRVFLFDAPR